MSTIDYYNFGVLRNDGNWSAFCLYNDPIRPDRFLTQVETVTSKNDVIQLIETRATNVKTRLEAKGFQNVILGTTQSSSNNYVYKSITYDAFPTSGEEGDGDDGDITIPDYTQILTSINSNLASIANKNNQSDIVDCLKLIFVNRISGVESSVMKVNTNNDNIKQNSSIPLLLSRIAQFLSSDPNFTWASSNDVQYRVLDNISKKLSFSTPINQSDGNSIFRILRIIAMSLSSNGGVNFGNDDNIVSNSTLKKISDKLANANDLHTISQAIDLISTAIAQTPMTDISPLTSAVQNLKLEQNNLIQVEGDIDYRIKYDKDKE